MIEGEEASQIFSYTFCRGQELPSFHESTISLATEAAVFHGFRPYASAYEDWQEAVTVLDDEVIDEDVNSHSRRRSTRLPSIGYFYHIYHLLSFIDRWNLYSFLIAADPTATCLNEIEEPILPRIKPRRSFVFGFFFNDFFVNC